MHITCHLKVAIEDSCVWILRAVFFQRNQGYNLGFGTRAVTVQRMKQGIISWALLPDCAQKIGNKR